MLLAENLLDLVIPLPVGKNPRLNSYDERLFLGLYLSHLILFPYKEYQNNQNRQKPRLLHRRQSFIQRGLSCSAPSSARR